MPIGRRKTARRTTMTPLSTDTGDLKLVDWRAVTNLIASTPMPKAPPPPPKRALWEAERRELVRRKLALELEGIRLYEALPTGEQVHCCYAMWIVMHGPNRCLAGEQEIYDPVTGQSERIDSIDGEFHVHSMNPETGNLEVRKASKPFVKCWGDLYRFTLSNGETLCATMEHRVVTAAGRWTSLADAIDGRPLAEFRVASTRRKKPQASHRASQALPQQASPCRVREGSRRNGWKELTSASGERHHFSAGTGEPYRESRPVDLQSRPGSSPARHTFSLQPRWAETEILASEPPQESAVSRPRSSSGISLQASV